MEGLAHFSFGDKNFVCFTGGSEHEKKTGSIFQCEWSNEKTAEMVAEAAGADLYEITPKVPYTKADLNWMDKKARSTVEMNDKKFRPELGGEEIDVSAYDEILWDSQSGGMLHRPLSIHFWRNTIFPVKRLFCLQHPVEADLVIQ